MFIQTQETPNPNSLKFLPGKGVSNDGPYEFLNQNQSQGSSCFPLTRGFTLAKVWHAMLLDT